MFLLKQAGVASDKTPLGVFSCNLVAFRDSESHFIFSDVHPVTEVYISKGKLQPGTGLFPPSPCLVLFNGSVVVVTDPEAIEKESDLRVLEVRNDYILMVKKDCKYVFPRELFPTISDEFYGWVSIAKKGTEFIVLETRPGVLLAPEPVFKVASSRFPSHDHWSYIDQHYPETVGKYRIPTLDMRLLLPYSRDFLIQVEKLSWVYQGWRKVRGDGNCYYRAVMVSFIELLCGFETPLSLIQSLIDDVRAEEGTFRLRPGHSHDMIITLLNTVIQLKLRNPGLALSEIQSFFQDLAIDTALVSFARLISANSLEDNVSYPPISSHVSDLQQEIDQILLPKALANGAVFLAMAEALQVNIYHECLMWDTSDLRTEVMHPRTGDTHPDLRLCYRPGHYDLLYLDGSEYDFNAHFYESISEPQPKSI